MAFNVLVLALLLLVAGPGTAEDDSIFFKSTLPPAKESYKILFLSPSKAKSHMFAEHALMIALANRGHEVVFLSESSWTDRHPNVTYVDHSADLPGVSNAPPITGLYSMLYFITVVREGLRQYAKKLFDDAVVQDLYKKRKGFDIIIIDEILFMALYPFVHGTTFAKFSCSTLHPYGGANFGNPLNPAFVSSSSEEFPQPYSTWHRFINCFHSLTFYIILRYFAANLAESEIASRFPSVPSPHVVDNNASLLFSHMDFTLDSPQPIVPLVVPVSGMTLRPLKPLPKDLSDFLSGGTPVIYVSLGVSFGDSKYLSQTYKDIFFSVFPQLPYKVLMKFNEFPKQNYSNFLIRKWLPQQDILAHPNVKAYLTQGGVLSVQETVRYGVPVIGLPWVVEHRRMIKGLVLAGGGLLIDWSELSVQTLKESIVEIIENPSYRNKMKEKSRIFNDQPQSPMDRAVYWTEYVARYKGAPHLQSPAKHLSWIEILNLDVIALVFLILYILLRLLMRLLRQLMTWIVRKWRGRPEKPKMN